MKNQCQSCGMPMKQDPKGGGTESDGGLSEKYCSYCFVDGAFTQPSFSAQDMQAFCIEKMKEMGYPRIIGWLFTRGIPKLERWSK
ncbi:zinc ribbon domain-containing protein [Hahella sp. NBU794]|uniref:zinc ribbon domain-containing protein n=1 Tax=Hahella sp. NBU794 TaxID=3422590 RepID=UPI003D6F6D94